MLLKKSRIGCHLNGSYCGVLSYADDITISCPSRRGLNRNVPFLFALKLISSIP